MPREFRPDFAQLALARRIAPRKSFRHVPQCLVQLTAKSLLRGSHHPGLNVDDVARPALSWYANTYVADLHNKLVAAAAATNRTIATLDSDSVHSQCAAWRCAHIIQPQLRCHGRILAATARGRSTLLHLRIQHNRGAATAAAATARLCERMLQ